ncbi:UNVERIFIED_CONTAM: hypothetical protein FKN15_074584 [Acipenser sinensis]
MDSMSSFGKSALAVPWGPTGANGAGGRKRSRSNSARTVPWRETAAQIFSICSESTGRLEWRLFFLFHGGGEGELELEEDEEDREDGFLPGLLSRAQSHGLIL